MTSNISYIILALLAGVCLPTQAGINARLDLWTRAPVLATTISFAVGTVGLALYALLLRIPIPSVAGLSVHPWWMWTGGLVGAFFVVATVILVPKLGATPMLALIVAGQMFVSLVFDHYGLLGYQVQQINSLRIIGVFLLVGGVVLILKN